MVCVASALMIWPEEGLFIAVIPLSRLASSGLITDGMQHRATVQYPECHCSLQADANFEDSCATLTLQSTGPVPRNPIDS